MFCEYKIFFTVVFDERLANKMPGIVIETWLVYYMKWIKNQNKVLIEF